MYQQQVTFGDAINRGIKLNYCNFNGRASRSEFWWFILFSWLVSFAAGLVFGCFGETAGTVAQSIVSLVLLLPTLGLGARRLHDIDKSGWWQLLMLIPLIGAIILIIWWAKPSQETPNQYGPVPNVGI